MVLKRRLQEQHILQEFILDIYSDSQLSEIIDVSPSESDIDTDIDSERETVQTGFTQWTYYTNLICYTCNPQHNGESSGLKQNKASHISKDPNTIERFHALQALCLCMYAGFSGRD
jgi:hypothetical protein